MDPLVASIFGGAIGFFFGWAIGKSAGQEEGWQEGYEGAWRQVRAQQEQGKTPEQPLD